MRRPEVTDPLLREVLAEIEASARPRRWQHWVRKGRRQTRAEVVRRLVADRVVTAERQRVLGIFPRTRITVRDHGRGFDARYADKLFEPFQRLHGVEEGSGSGLGLAVASRIVARHGGRIWAQSESGAGSTFFIELPAGPDQREHAR